MKKIFKQCLSLFLVLFLVLQFPLPASAAQSSKEMAASLKSKYGMTISFVSDYTEREKLDLLNQMDSVFSHVGAAFVKEVASVYIKNGYTTSLRMEKTQWGEQMGLFGVSNKNATIRIMTSTDMIHRPKSWIPMLWSMSSAI